MKTKPSAWLTPRQAARLVGWNKPDDGRKMIRALRRIEKKTNIKLLIIIPTPMKTRLMVTLASLRRAMPDKFLLHEEHLPVAIAEKFTKVEEHVEEVAGRIGEHGSRIRSHGARLTALEAMVRKLQSVELRLVKGGLK